MSKTKIYANYINIKKNTINYHNIQNITFMKDRNIVV
jgi:hypothetical protein